VVYWYGKERGETDARLVGGMMEGDLRANVEYPAHPVVNQKEGDHYRILQHAMGLVDLTADDDGRAVLSRYKQDADLAMGSKPPRVPEVGELPPSHLEGAELEKWLERQRTQALLEGETV
jgi:hypothetical protein